MAIFGKEDTPEPTPTPQASAPTGRQPQPVSRATQIAPGTTIQGEIRGKTAVQIDGVLDGRVQVEGRVSVGAKGQVKGEIHAQEVEVAGKVTGNILGDAKIDIHSSAKLQGDVKAPRVSIADGAYFKGRVEMATETAPQPPKPTPKPKLDSVQAVESSK